MKSQTFGVEIEMNDITREHAAETAAKFFGTNNYKYTAGINGYRCWSAWDGQGREWKFERDSSIITENDDERCEMVTPILKYDDIELLQEVVRQLRHEGAKSDDTRGCGVHIHIGADGQTATSLRHLANMMAAHEQLIIGAIRVANHRLSHFCRPVDPRFLKEINEKKPTTMSDLADIWYESQGCGYGRNDHYNDSRYHILNLHATFTKGTIEFRCFQFDRPGRVYKGGLHAGKLKAWIQFCLAICDAAKKARASRPDHVQMDNPKYAMTGWLCRMGLVGDEFETLRKTFNEHLEGNAGVRYPHAV